MTVGSVLLLCGLAAVFAAGCALICFASRRKRRLRALLLDADGTLFDFDRSEKEALAAAFHAVGLEADEHACAVYHRHNDDCWKALERGEMTRAELKEVRFARTFAELGLSADPAQTAAIYEKNLGQRQFPYPGAEETVAELSRRYDVYIVTNGTKAVQDAKMKLTTVPQYCREIYISEEVGHAKPAPEFFDAIFRDHPRLRREETMIVGDSLTGDIKGGMNAGIATCWVNPNGDPAPEGYRVDLQVRSVNELNDLL